MFPLTSCDCFNEQFHFNPTDQLSLHVNGVYVSHANIKGQLHSGRDQPMG